MLHAAVCRENLPHLADYIQYFRGEGIRDYRLHFASPQFELRLDKDTVPSFREAMPVVRRLILKNEDSWGLHVLRAVRGGLGLLHGSARRG